MIVQGIYQAAPITVADGAPITLLVDDQGRLIVTVTGGGGGSADVNVAEWGGVATTLGQKVMASSVPVVLASNQSSVPANLSNILAEADNATIAQSATANALKVNSRLYGLNGTNWIRLGCDTAGNIFVRNAFVEVTPADNQTNGVAVATAARGQVFDGTTWDLARGSPSTLNAIDSTGSNIKASAGQMLGLTATNTQAAPLYFQLWNTATVAGTGTLLYQWIFPVAVLPFVLDQSFWTPSGKPFSTGMAFGWSSTSGTFTAAAVATGLHAVFHFL